MLTTIYLEGDRCWRRAEGCEGSARCRWSYESKFVSTSAAVSSGSFPFKRNAILYFFYQNKVFCVLRVNILQNKWKINCFLKFCPFLKRFYFWRLEKKFLFQTLSSISSERNHTIVFPFPMEVARYLLHED